MIGYSDWRGVFYGFLLVLPFLMIGLAIFRVILAIFWKKETVTIEVLKKRKHQQSNNMDLEKRAIPPHKKYLKIDRINNFMV